MFVTVVFEKLLLQNETDWDMFLKTSIEIIAVVAEYALFETFNQIVSFYLVNFRKLLVFCFC